MGDVSDGATVRKGGDWWWFAGWALVGAGAALGVLGAMTIGVVVLPVVAGAAVLLAARRGSGAGVAGLVVGAAVPLLYVAYLNRDGPGTVCRTTPGGSSCTDEWSPWPFLVVALVLVVVGFVLQWRRGVRAPDAG